MHVTLLAAGLVLLHWRCTTLAFATPSSLDVHPHRQHVSQILASIEEQLRSLQRTFGGGGGQPLTEVTGAADLQGIARRLEAVETRLARIEGSLDTRLTTLSENIGRRQGKEESAYEASSHKLEIISERIFNKLGYMEAKIDEKLNKLTSKIETYPTEEQRISKTDFPSSSSCCHQLTKSLTTGEARIKKDIANLDQKVEEVRKVARKVDESNLVQKITNFMDNACNAFKQNEVISLVREMGLDLWRRTVVLEEKVLQTSGVANLTLFHIQEMIKRSVTRFDTQYTQPYPSQGSYPGAVDSQRGENRIITKINDVDRQLQYQFKILFDEQRKFRESCKLIQDSQPTIENSIEKRLIDILEIYMNETSKTKHLREVMSTADKKLDELMEFTKNSSDLNFGNVKNIYSNLSFLRDMLKLYLSEFTVKMVATRVVEDLKPILLKFVDESILSPSSFAAASSSNIFQEMEHLISMNKSIATEDKQLLNKTDDPKQEQFEEDEYDEAPTTPGDDYIE